MNNDDASEQDKLQESASKTNSNLQLLIEAIGGLLAASGDLLMRLQGILGGAQPAASSTNGGDECGSAPPPERRDE